MRQRAHFVGQLLICNSGRLTLSDPCLIIDLDIPGLCGFYRILCNEKKYLVFAEELQEFPT